MYEDCLFCKIVRGEIPSWNLFESETHLAFLTPFPNTPGFTVLIPKQHLPSAIFSLEEKEYQALLDSAREVAHLLERGLSCKRVAMIAEGMAIDHAHIKLIPLHGIPDGQWQPVLSHAPHFSEKYEGFLTTHDGPRMNDEELSNIQGAILRAKT
jgi:diadenosine tetraphosphate (Ap4A) HIT family hydrolase